MTINKYYQALNNFGDIKLALKDLLLMKGGDQSGQGQVTLDDELSFWINRCYVLLEQYDWRWALGKTTLAITAGTSKYSIPLVARDIKPVKRIVTTSGTVIDPAEKPDFDSYMDSISGRTGSGTPREFGYVETDDTEVGYTTGVVTGSANLYALVGVGTAWLSNLFCGSIIDLPAPEPRNYVAKVINDTTLALKNPLSADVSSAAYTAYTSYPRVQIDLNPIPAESVTATLYYHKRFTPMIIDEDIPLLPLSARWVLADGAYQLYQWFHENTEKVGIQPATLPQSKDLFINSPATIQKFFNLYVAKLLSDEKSLSGPVRVKMKFKRGY